MAPASREGTTGDSYWVSGTWSPVLGGEAGRARGWRRRYPGEKAEELPRLSRAGSALPARRVPAALVTFTRGLGPSCSPGLSLLIYYSARLDCLIAEMCSSLYQRASSFGGKISVDSNSTSASPVYKETPSAICHHPARPQARLAAAEF